MRKLLLIPLILGFVFVGAGLVTADTTVVVSGDTTSTYNDPGKWWFNRDTSTDTPFEFNQDHASIGDGSLYVLPIGANASDKFIAEHFLLTPVADIDFISYDFLIGGGGDASDENEFYMNVYANFGESDPEKFYDCRYNIVPTIGSTASFTTVTFDPTETYPVTTGGSSPYACPGSPSDMDSLSNGSTVRMIALNVGDTSAGDTGLDGYLDNVAIVVSGDTTTYDFDPYPVSGEILEPEEDEIVTGITDLVAAYDDGDDDNDDAVNWAVREGTCDAGVNTVFGNVDGHSDDFEWDGANFSAEWDTAGAIPGMYCFIFNPTDDPGQDDVRLTREFFVAESYVNGGGHLLEESGKRKDWLDVSFGGWVADVGELIGEWQVNLHNVAADLDRSKFHGSEITELNMFDGDDLTCNDAVNFTVNGMWNGEAGHSMIFRAGDFGSPNTEDTVRITIYGGTNGTGGVIYDTHDEFPGESSCVGTARTGLDNGNITIIDNS